MGTPEECSKKIREYANVGITYFVLRFVDPLRRKEDLQFFAKEATKSTHG